MPIAATLATQAHLALKEAKETVAQHGSPERLASLENITLERAHLNFPHHLAAFNAELFAALAEIIREQNERIAALEEALEKPAASKESARAAKK